MTTIPNTNAYLSKGDLLSKQYLYNILTDTRIIDIVKVLLGEDIVYFYDSSYQVGTGQKGWHRDNVDRAYNSGPEWQGTYEILRMGLYLQDHSMHIGGLKVKSGSHLHPDGKVVFIDNTPGDLVIWNLKTIHSGNAVRLKFFPNLSFDEIEKYIPRLFRREEELERISLFMTFGKLGTHLDRYFQEYLLKRADTRDNLIYSYQNQCLGADTSRFRLEIQGSSE